MPTTERSFGVDNGIAAGGAHAVSTAAEEFELRAAAMQGLNELRPIHFPGSPRPLRSGFARSSF